MQVTHSDEQRLLRELAERIATDFRAMPMEIGRQRSDPESWRVPSELGLFEMYLPDGNGAACSAVDLAILCEAFGQTPAVVPFAGRVLAFDLLARAGELDPSSAVTIYLNDKGTGSAEPEACAVAWDAAGSSGGVGVVRRPDGRAVATRAELTPEEIPPVDITRIAKRVKPGTAREIGELGAESYLRWETLALTLLSADMLGVMKGALDLAVAYAGERRQFGRPIGSFQALQHSLADCFVAIRGAESATLHAANMIDSGDAEKAAAAARVANAFNSRAAIEVAEAAMQVHGGIGSTWESQCHIFLRRAVSDASMFGGEDRQLREIARTRMGDTDEA